MFCTIEDAWGSKDLQHSSFTNNNPDKSINTDNTFNKEMFEQSDKPESFKSNEYTFEDKSTTNDKSTSNDKSKQDYDKVKKYFTYGRKKGITICYLTQSFYTADSFIRKQLSYILLLCNS
jgi:hypothetical protein